MKLVTAFTAATMSTADLHGCLRDHFNALSQPGISYEEMAEIHRSIDAIQRALSKRILSKY